MHWILVVVLVFIGFASGFLTGFVLREDFHRPETFAGTIISDDSDGELYLFMEVANPELLKRSGTVTMKVSHKN